MSSTNLGPHRRTSKREHCPICDKPDGCLIFDDGRGVACLREKSDHQTPGGWWYHRLNQNDDWRDHLPNFEAAPPPPPKPIVDEDLCDRAYRALLVRCPLNDTHRLELRQRGMTDAQIEREGYGSLPEEGRSELTAAVIADVGAEIMGAVPGFYTYDGTPTLRGLPGLLIPIRDASGAVRRLRVRPDDPAKRAEGKYRWISSADLPDGIGSGTVVHFAHPKTETTKHHRVGLTEGELKAAIAAHKTGMPFLSMPGVGAIGSLAKVIPTLRAKGVGEVVFGFDADAETNPMVASGIARSAELLESEGFTIVYVTWPAGFKGIDDALVAGIMPMIERRIAVDNADVFAENARLKAENAELRAKLAGQAGEHAAYVQAQRAPHLGPERQVGAAVINTLSAARASGADEWVRMPYAKVADAAGVSERAVPRHIKKLNNVWGDHVELKTEWAPDLGHKVTVARLVTSGREALLAVATAPPSEKGSKNGNGGRRVCPTCGDVGIKRVTTDYCLGCGEQLDHRATDIAGGSRQSVRNDVEPEPTHHDSLSGCPPPPKPAPTYKRSPLETLLSPAKVASFHNGHSATNYAAPPGWPGFDRWTE